MDDNNYKVNNYNNNSPNKSILKQQSSSNKLPSYPPSPQKSPTKNKVSISTDEVTIHRYLSRSPIKMKKSKRLFNSDYSFNNDLINDINNDNNNINNNDIIIIDQYESSDNNNDNDNDKDNETVPTESNFYESNSSNESVSSLKSKFSLNKLKQYIEYPIHKFDKLQEETTIFIYNNYKYTKYLIYLIAILLNVMLIGYSLDYLGPIFGLVLLAIGISNSISFFKSIKTYQLYRYEGKSFQSPNMSLIQVEYDGVNNQIPTLNVWEPKFISKILFSLFNPLNILIMFKAGPRIEDFICFASISFSISFMVYYIISKYEEKIHDEKIIFNQLVNEYNHYMRAIPPTLNKSTMTNE